MISAELLKREGYHASSVHCSYYGLFQKMKYTMKTYLDISYDEYDRNSKEGSYGSHAYLINLLCEEYKKIKSPKEANNINRRLYDLKTQRETADYDNVVITQDKSEDAYDMATKLIYEIKQTFKI